MRLWPLMFIVTLGCAETVAVKEATIIDLSESVQCLGENCVETTPGFIHRAFLDRELIMGLQHELWKCRHRQGVRY